MKTSKLEEKINPITTNLANQKIALPPEFKFKILNPAHLDEIHSLLSNHYTEDGDHIRLIYSKDFLYWYLKYIPAGFIIGLVCCGKGEAGLRSVAGKGEAGLRPVAGKGEAGLRPVAGKGETGTLVGLITATFLDMIVYGTKLKVPYINLLCVQSKIRNSGLGKALIEEIKQKIIYASFTTMKPIDSPFSTSKDFVIPVNHAKLKKIGFLTEDLPPLDPVPNNPLHLLMPSELIVVVPKLNKFLEKFDIKPYFTEDSAHHFFLPKKNIVYSFVKRNEKGTVTDFISVYQHYYILTNTKQSISVGQLAFYYHETLTLTELVTYLLDKLPSYQIDQLVFRNIADNMMINLTRFDTDAKLNYFFYNVNIKQTENHKLCTFPF